MYLEGQATGGSTAVEGGVGLPAVAPRRCAEAGFALAALLVAIAILSVFLLVTLPTWRHQVQREKEAELVFRGEQYARAIGLYQRKLAGAFPPSLDALVEQKFLRKRYKDPISGDDFEPVFANSAAGLSALGGGQQTQGRGQAQGQSTVGVEITSEPGGRGRATMTFQSPRGGQSGPGAPAPTAPSGPGGRGGGAATGIVGVRSKSTAQSIRLYNGRDHYDQWIFVYMAQQPQQPQQPQGRPQGPGRGGASTTPGRRGPF